MHQPHDDVGVAPSGFGLLGIVTRDETGVECHECGRWFGMLVQHLRGAHHMTVAEYRAEHGLPAGVPLTSLGTSALIGAKSRERMESDPAGWARFEAARDKELPETQRLAAQASARASVGTKAVRAARASERFSDRALDDDLWARRLAAFVAHWKRTGTPPSRNSRDASEKSLAKWLQHQRDAWRRGELTQDRRAALEQEGIPLDPGTGTRWWRTRP